MDQFFVDEDGEFPTGHYACPLWRDPAPVATVAGFRETFEKIATFTDSTRAGRQLLRCRASGQLYLVDFEERPDYAAGNDEQSMVLVPVDPQVPILDLVTADATTFRSALPRLEIMPTNIVGRDRAVWVKG